MRNLTMKKRSQRVRKRVLTGLRKKEKKQRERVKQKQTSKLQLRRTSDPSAT
ncbi:conserved hypothetical protein [Ricinus communis]|uniref:Uncharacterized protein n=1 Tax=Ricinus communis TaxID=3988 RepID=B9RZJ3_RICCO|nr:conserved hypothetical protein [Ricinus communis]